YDYPTIWSFVIRGIRYGSLSGALLGAIYGSLLAPIFGTLLGLVLGGGVGMVLGIPTGTVIAWITRLAYPRLSRDFYCFLLIVCSSLVAGVGTFLAFALLFHLRLFGPPDINLFPFAGLPAIVAAAAAAWSALRIGAWYVQVKTPTA